MKKQTDYFIAIGMLLVMAGTCCIAHFNGLFGQDAHEYLHLSRQLSDYFANGIQIIHPYYPVLYPLVSFLFSKILWNNFVALQSVSMLSLVAVFFYVRKLIALVHGQRNFVNQYLLCFFFLSPYVFRFAIVSMSDMLCLLLVVAAAYHALHYSKFSTRRDVIFAVLFSGLALQTRYAVAVIICVFAITLLFSFFKKKDWKSFLIAGVVAAVSILPDWIITHRIIFFQFANGNVSFAYAPDSYQWSIMNFFRSHFINTDGEQHYHQWNIFFAAFNIIHPAFVFAGIVFLFFLKKNDFRRTEIKILCIAVLLYGLYLAGISYQSNRYLLQTFPFVLVVFYPAFERIVEKYFVKQRSRIMLVSSVALLQFALILYSCQLLFSVNHTEQEIAATLKAYPGETIYTCAINSAMNSYEVKNKVIDLYEMKIDSVEKKSMLLFNFNEFSQHFKDVNPMKNWDFIHAQCNVDSVQSFGNGWTLYTLSGR